MSVDPRAPCLVGVAQYVSRPDDGPRAEPLDQWERVCADAVNDAGGRGVTRPGRPDRVLPELRYDDPPGRLSDRFGIGPRRQYYSGIGGTTPQVLVNRAAEDPAR